MQAPNAADAAARSAARAADPRALPPTRRSQLCALFDAGASDNRLRHGQLVATLSSQVERIHMVMKWK